MDPPSYGDRRASLVSRWMAALVLVVLLAAGALSAWLVVHADLARSGRVAPTSGSRAAEDLR